MRGENLYILPASCWWSYSLPAFKQCVAYGIAIMNGLRGGFINIKDMYNNDVCKGGVWVCDTDVTLLPNYDNMDLARSHVMILTSPPPLSSVFPTLDRPTVGRAIESTTAPP
jgi:hypothetical protein